MISIISPAKTQDFTKSALKTHTLAIFAKESQELVSELKKLSKSDIQNLMSVSEKIAELNFNRFKNFQKEFNLENAKQAILAFQGDVYQDIDTENYSAADFEFAQDHLRIISGLYGILRPLDLIQPYRLEMKTPFKFKNHSNLYSFWGEILKKELGKIARNGKVINLASNEYSKAVIFGDVSDRTITPAFKDFKNGEYKIIPIYAKIARGSMTNFIIKNKIDDAENLKEFSENGYVFDKKSSSETEFIFLRKS